MVTFQETPKMQLDPLNNNLNFPSSMKDEQDTHHIAADVNHVGRIGRAEGVAAEPVEVLSPPPAYMRSSAYATREHATLLSSHSLIQN